MAQNSTLLGQQLALIAAMADWPCSDADLAAWDRITERATQNSSDPFTAAADLDIDFSPGLWLMVLASVLHNIESVSTGFIDQLPLMWGILGRSEPPDLAAQIGAMCDAVKAFKHIDETFNAGALRQEDCAALVRLIEVLPDTKLEQAYDILLLAIAQNVLGHSECLDANADLAFWERGAATFDRVARIGNKPAQMATGAMALAIVALAHADRDVTQRFAAFCACEIAVERLTSVDTSMRRMICEPLVYALLKREFTRPLLIYLVSDFDLPNKDKLLKVIGPEPWPSRVRRLTLKEYTDTIDRVLKRLSFEFQIDNARYALLPAVAATSIAVDWNSWRFDYLAYRRAAPSGRSLLRERHFATILLDIIHEVTHVFSLAGGLGVAVCIYRIAAMRQILNVLAWNDVRISEKELIRRRGIPDLEPGKVAHLIDALTFLTPLQNARIIQDVWTPWFEGLAVFAESTSDPTDHAVSINDALLAIRGFIDFHPNAKNEADVMAEGEKFAAAFDKAASDAVRDKSAMRLRVFFENPKTPYLAGYLLVRGVVARWRATTNSDLSGTQALQLLLHATRFLTTKHLRNLQLFGIEFQAATTAAFVEFIQTLLALRADEIAAFMAHPKADESGRPYEWKNGHLREFTAADGGAERLSGETAAFIESRFDEAKRAAGDAVADIARKAVGTDIGTVAEAFAEAIKEVDDEANETRWHRVVNELVIRSAILPLGMSESRFCLSDLQDQEIARLDIIQRTTEEHVETGEPSMNARSWPISHEDANCITEHHLKSGESIMNMYRVVDIGASPQLNAGYRFAHLYWTGYGDWRSVQGATLLGQNYLDSLPDRNVLSDRIASRLMPNGLQILEQEVLADGKTHAGAVLDWLSKSMHWTYEGTAMEPGSLPDTLRQMATFLTDANARIRLQQQAVRLGLQTIFGEAAWIDGLFASGFAALTKGFADIRQELLEAIAASGRRPIESEVLDRHAADLAAGGFPIFANTGRGWDITSRFFQEGI